MTRKTAPILIAIGLGAMVTCSSVVLIWLLTRPKTANIPLRKLDFSLPPSYVYTGQFLLPDGRLGIFIYSEKDSRSVEKYLVGGDTSVHELPLGDDPLCTRYTEYVSPTPLPDGRLGFVKICAGQDPTRPGPLGDKAYLMAYDWSAGNLKQIVDGPLPDSSLSREFTWNPTMTLGVQALTGLDGTIYWISPAGVVPMTITVSDKGRSWSLDDNYDALANHQETQSTGIARAPEWSPDGKVVAFLSNVDAIGREGMNRSDGEWGLYFMSPADWVPQKVLGGIYDPAFMRWSPDGNWIALLIKSGRWGKWGIWLFSPDTRRLALV